MKRRKLRWTGWGVLVLGAIVQAAAAERPEAEVFAPGIVSLPERIEFCLAMTPDENEVFFAVRRAPGQWEIRHARRVGDSWETPANAPFSGSYSDCEPTLSPDGRRLFFVSNRPVPPGTEAADYNIWLVEREEGGWSAPRPLPPPVNGPGDQWRASQSRAGTLFYSSGGLWNCGFDGTAATEPTRLFDPRQPGALIGGHPFVAPDESYLLTAWMDGPGGRGGWDLYVSFRDPKGSWGPSINLGDDVNTEAGEDFPLVSPGGGDLFFFRYKKVDGVESGDIYRVGAGILAELRKQAALVDAAGQKEKE
jgi:hypothetical protein